MNGLSVCLDEIALEGLDGITISTLWRRLDSASFSSTIDENYKEFLWRCVSSSQDIEAYLLQSPRAEILDFPDDTEVYPYCCISEEGIRGSCSTFKTRTLINISNLSLLNAVATYGNKLVLVASQLLRDKVLLGPEFDVSVKIPETSYCLLEIIGRARKLGRLQSNLGLQTMIDSRSLFALVKTLLKLQLITKQSVVGYRPCPSGIIYLARYHVEHALDSLQFKITTLLSKSPDQHLPLESLCLELEEDKEIIERVVQELCMSKHVCYVNLKDSDKISSLEKCLDTCEDTSEGMYGTQELLESEGNKVIQFVHQFYNLNVDGDNEVEDEEWLQPEKQDLSMSFPAEMPVMHVIYNFIESKGQDGASLSECCEALSYPFFCMRQVLKNMELSQVLFCKFVEEKTTQKNVYVARKASQGPGNVAQPPQSSALQSTPSLTTHPLSVENIANTQRPATTYPPTATHPPATTQIGQHPTTQHPSCHIFNNPPAVMINQNSLTTISQHQVPQIGSVVNQAPQMTTPSACTAQIRNPHMLLTNHPSTSTTTILQGSKNSVVPTTHVVVQNSGRILEENNSRPELSSNSVNGQTKKKLRTRSQKLLDTEKFIRRKESILNLLNDFKVVGGIQPFVKYIRTEEKKMGLGIFMDRRTVINMLKKLEADGLLKKFEMDITVEDEEHQVKLFCDDSVQEDDEEIASYVQRFKDRIILQRAKRSGLLVEIKTKPNSGNFLPKMQRVELLHMFLFYVIYELRNPNVDLETMRRKYDWAEHLKPEHVPKNIGKGWFTPYSVLQLLPVSLYFKLVDTSYHNFVLQQYFDNPATKNMLLKDLPPLARQILLEVKKNYFLFETFEYLTFFGLITPTNKLIFFHERDIMCYLHNSSIMKDTRESMVGYNEVKHPEDGEFPEKESSFSEMADVETYWNNIRIICMSTPLNRRGAPYDTKSRFYTNFEVMVIDHKEVGTCGKPRGDGLGAGGFDSHLHCHLPNKWNWTLVEKQGAGVDSDFEDTLDWRSCFTNDGDLHNIATASSSKKKTKRKRQKPAQGESAKKKRKVDVQKKKDENQKDAVCSTSQQSVTPAHNYSSNLSKNVDKGKKKRKKRKKKKKKKEPKPNNAKPKTRGHWNKQIHDKRDEEALKQMQATRNTFTQQQHKLLFICCLALRIIGKKSVDTGYRNWLWTRDVLYKDNYESAKTKTALSIRRKYCTMIANAQTKTNLDICVADCMQEQEFQPYCNIVKKCDEAMFNELVELLKHKYSIESIISNRFVLPPTMKQFHQQKNVYSSLEVENSEKCDEDVQFLEPRETSVADIRQRIIRDSIVSALLATSGSYQSHVTFKFLSQFTEEELIIAISLLKNGRIVVRKQLRYAHRGFDLASCAFSQMLSSNGQRIIDHHFPTSLIEDAVAFYNEIANASKSVNGVEEQSLPLAFSESSIQGGKVFCILSLLACQRLAVNMEVPDILLALEENQKSRSLKPVPEKSSEKQNVEIEEIEREDVSALSIASASTHDDPSETINKSKDEASEERCSEEVAARERCSSTNIEDSSQSREFTSINKTPDERRNKETATTSHTANDRNKDVGESFQEEETVTLPGNINRKLSNDMVLDVLCGIEDHLFGFLGTESNTPLYKVNLRPTSTFTCTMTTSDVDPIRASNHVVVGDVEASNLQDKTVYECYLEKISTYQRTGDLNRILFSINPCNAHVRLLSGLKETSTNKAESLAQSVVTHFKSNGLTIPNTIEECITLCSKLFGYSGKDCEALKTVYETIYSSKEIGMSVPNVSKVIRSEQSVVRFSTDGLIKVLEAFSLVYQVGFVEVCYVAKSFKEHWFLNFRWPDVRFSEISRLEKEGETSRKRKRSDFQDETQLNRCTKSDVPEESQVPQRSSDVMMLDNTTLTTNSSNAIDEEDNSRKESSTQTQTDSYSNKPCRPWITMAGETNKNAYNILHRSVLAYVIKYPGVQKYAIAKHFVNLVFQVAVDDILQKLEECGCIEQHVCYIKKQTLFSSKAGNRSSYYLPKPDAMLKLTERVLLS